MAAKNEKSVSLTNSDVNTFLEGKENQYTKKKPKCKYEVALTTAFLAAESENRQLEDLPQADVAVYLKDFFCW